MIAKSLFKHFCLLNKNRQRNQSLIEDKCKQTPTGCFYMYERKRCCVEVSVSSVKSELTYIMKLYFKILNHFS